MEHVRIAVFGDLITENYHAYEADFGISKALRENRPTDNTCAYIANWLTANFENTNEDYSIKDKKKIVRIVSEKLCDVANLTPCGDSGETVDDVIEYMYETISNILAM